MRMSCVNSPSVPLHAQLPEGHGQQHPVLREAGPQPGDDQRWVRNFILRILQGILAALLVLRILWLPGITLSLSLRHDSQLSEKLSNSWVKSLSWPCLQGCLLSDPSDIFYAYPLIQNAGCRSEKTPKKESRAS